MLPVRLRFEVSVKLSHAIASKMVLSYIPLGLVFMKIVCVPLRAVFLCWGLLFLKQHDPPKEYVFTFLFEDLRYGTSCEQFP